MDGCPLVIHLAAIVGGIGNFHKLPLTLTEMNNGLYNGIFRAALVEPRRTALRTIIDRGIARGELREDLDPEALVDLLSAPYLYRLLIDGGDVEQAFAKVPAYLDLLLRGMLPR